MQQRIFAKNVPKLRKYLCGCPFLGHSYFEFKCFAQIRTCNIMCIFGVCNHSQIDDMQYAHKIMKNISSPNSAKMLSYVIILLSSRGSYARHIWWDDIIYHAKNHGLKCARKIRRKCYHFVIIVIDNTFYDDPPIWCIFLSFFLVQKMTFFHPLFYVTIMLS